MAGSVRPAAAPTDVAPEPHSSPAVAVTVIGVLLLVLVAMMAASMTLLYVPLRAGTVLVPICLLLAAIANYVLPRLVRGLTPNGFAAALPSIAWFVTMAVLAGSRPEGDVLIPGGTKYQSLDWIFYGTVLVGVIVGLTTVARTGPGRRVRARPVPAADPPAPGSVLPRSGSSRPGSTR